MINRPRRLRKNPLIRGMVRETRASADSLIYPIFFEEGTNIKAEIAVLSGRIKELRREVRLCEDIAVRSLSIISTISSQEHISIWNEPLFMLSISFSRIYCSIEESLFAVVAKMSRLSFGLNDWAFLISVFISATVN